MQPQLACNELAREDGVEDLETRATRPDGEESSARYGWRWR